MIRLCSIKDCNGKHYGHGLCRKHWRKTEKYKAYLKEYNRLKETKERHKLYARKYRKYPYVKQYYSNRWKKKSLEENFYENRKKYFKEYYRRPEVQRRLHIYKTIAYEKRRELYKKKRFFVLQHYSNNEPNCVCCNEKTLEFLILHHKYGGGNQHRKKAQIFGGEIYNWIIKNNFPDDFEVLCANCHNSIGVYGYCKHQKNINKMKEMNDL